MSLNTPVIGTIIRTGWLHWSIAEMFKLFGSTRYVSKVLRIFSFPIFSLLEGRHKLRSIILNKNVRLKMLIKWYKKTTLKKIEFKIFSFHVQLYVVL